MNTISLKKAEEQQNDFKSNLVEITWGNPKRKEKLQLSTINNVKNLYDSRQIIIDLLNGCVKIRSKAFYKPKQDGTGLAFNEMKLHSIIKMDIIFMNSKNSQTSKPHVLMLKFTDKLDLRKGENRIALSNLGIYYTWKNIKSSYSDNKFKISAPTWNDQFELPDGSCSVSNIQDYFEYIFKKHGGNIDNPLVKIYVNKIENRIAFRIKNGYNKIN